MLFGAGATYDAYVLGFRIPSLARELFAEGALSSAFIPTFTQFLTTKSKEEARELSNVTGTMLLLITGTFCGLGMLLSPWIVGLFAPGFHATPGKFELAVSLVRTMFPFLLLLALSAQCQGILNATGSFGIPAVSPALFNLATIAAGLTLGYVIGPHIGLEPIRGMAYGIVIGGVAQLAFQLPAVWRAGFRWSPRWNLRANFRHEGFLKILALMGDDPLDLPYDLFLRSMIHKGKIIWNGLASELMNTGDARVDQFTHGRREGPIEMELRK